MSKDKFVCPITKQIFKDPVVAEDGHIYEKDAIVEWFKKKSNSPMTRRKIDKKMYPLVQFNNELKEFLQKNPALLEEQYKNAFPYDITEVTKILNVSIGSNCDFTKLLSFTNFKLLDQIVIDYNTQVATFLEIILSKCEDDSIIKYVLDNSVDSKTKSHISQETDDVGYPIHILCKFGNYNIIKHALKLLLGPSDLEVVDNLGRRPIHYILKFNKSDNLIKLFLSKGVSISYLSADGTIPINMMFESCSLDIIRYLIKYKFYINNSEESYEDGKGLVALDYLFKRKDITVDFLKFLKKYKIDLNYTNENNWAPVHYMLLTQPLEIIKYTLTNFAINKPLKRVRMIMNTSSELNSNSFKLSLTPLSLINMNKRLNKLERRDLQTFLFIKQFN